MRTASFLGTQSSHYLGLLLLILTVSSQCFFLWAHKYITALSYQGQLTWQFTKPLVQWFVLSEALQVAQLTHPSFCAFLGWGKHWGQRSVCPSCQLENLTLPFECSIQSEGQRPPDWKMSLIQAQDMQKGVPASVVRPKRPTKLECSLRPCFPQEVQWACVRTIHPPAFHSFTLPGLWRVWEAANLDTKTEVSEGRDSPKGLG